MKKSLMLLTAVLLTAGTVLADPVAVFTEHSPLQDNWAIDGWVEELSTSPHDPTKQLIASRMVPWNGHIPCPADYQNEESGTTVQVEITNLTTRYFEELYYVGDVHDDGTPETVFTNLDEFVGDVTPGNPGVGVHGWAFKIDAIGLNTPLVFESLTPDGIFEPGEIWEFVVQEYTNMFALPASALASVGPPPFGAIAQASMGDLVSSASIITPEPMTVCLLGLGALALRKKLK